MANVIVVMAAAADDVPPHLPQGWYLSQLPADIPLNPRACLGLSVWLVGFLNVVWADHILISLRKPGETGQADADGMLGYGIWQ